MIAVIPVEAGIQKHEQFVTLHDTSWVRSYCISLDEAGTPGRPGSGARARQPRQRSPAAAQSRKSRPRYTSRTRWSASTSSGAPSAMMTPSLTM